MEKEYLVTSVEGVDISEVDIELAASGGSDTIPDRECLCSDTREINDRITNWMLTEEEAQKLLDDPRIFSVDLRSSFRENTEFDGKGISRVSPTITQTSFDSTVVANKYQSADLYSGNWGLKRLSCDTKEDNFVKAATEYPTKNNSTGAITYTPLSSLTHVQEVYWDANDPAPLEVSEVVSANIDDTPLDYDYDGEGVDIVIVDDGVMPTHPEWIGADGNSRFKAIDWFKLMGKKKNVYNGSSVVQVNEYMEDLDRYYNKTFILPLSANEYGEWRDIRTRAGRGAFATQLDNNFDHGTSVAGAAVGKYNGVAKGAHLYVINLDNAYAPIGDDTNNSLGSKDYGPDLSNFGDAVVAFHKDKIKRGNTRPTVVNMSFGHVKHVNNSTVVGGTFRGTPWTYNNETSTELEEKYLAPFENYGNSVTTRLPNPSRPYDVMTQQMWDAGVHVVIAGGNDRRYQDLENASESTTSEFGNVASLDWDNEVTYNPANGANVTSYVNRPFSPHYHKAYKVGRFAGQQRRNYDDGNGNARYTEVPTYQMAHGPAVNIYAPEAIVTACYANDYQVTHPAKLPVHPDDSDYCMSQKFGTSFSAPMVAGLVACFCEKYPNKTNDEIRELVFNACTSNLGLGPNDSIPTGQTYKTHHNINSDPVRDFGFWGKWNPKGPRRIARLPYDGKANQLKITGKFLFTSNNFGQSFISGPAFVLDSSTTNLTLTLRNNEGVNQAAHGLPVEFTTDNGSLGSVVDNNNGTYTVAFSSPNTLGVSSSISAKVFGNTVATYDVITSTDTFEFLSAASTSLDEYTGANQTVYTALTNRNDAVYSLVSPSTGFTFDSNTREVTFTDNPIYNATSNTYPFTIQASIAGGVNITQTVILTVNNVAPVFTSGSVANSVNENIITTAGIYAATSNHAGTTFTLSTASQANFSISEHGVVRNTTAWNYETHPSVTFDVIATDAFGLSTTKTVTMNVNNVAENPPLITSGTNTSITLAENNTANSVVHTVTATSGVGGLVYSLVDTSNQGGGAFTINSSTGEITITYSHDYEVAYSEGNTAYIDYRVTDSAGSYTNDRFEINFTDVADSAPVLQLDGHSFNGNVVPENTSTSTVISSYQCGNVSAANTTWSLDTNTDKFKIDKVDFADGTGSYGRISFLNNYDYEAHTSHTYNLIVRATDSSQTSNNTTSSNFTVLVSNVDDNAPQWTVADSNIQYNAPLSSGSTLIDVSSLVSDADGSISNPIAYSITSGMPTSGYYSVNSAGLVTNGFTFSSTGTGVSLTVKATDAAGNHSSHNFTVEGVASALHTSTVTKGVYSQSNGSANYYGFHYQNSSSSMTNSTFHNNAAIRTVSGFRYQNYTPSIRFNLAGGHANNNTLFNTITVNVGGTDYTLSRSAASYYNAYGQETQFTWSTSGSSVALSLYSALNGLSNGQTFTVEWN